MKTLNLVISVCTTLLIAFAVAAEEPAPKAQKSEQTSDVSATPPVSAQPPPAQRPIKYQPPKLGKPARSVGGGSRGSSDTIPSMYLLVPDHVGQTISASPSLFWYVDRVPESSVRIEFTILDEDSIAPLFETTLPAPAAPGLQRIRLAELGVDLAPGSEYEWSVALILDPDERSKDVVATGWIDRVEATSALTSRIEGGGDAAAVYAEAGLWYDALTAISDEIDRHPGDSGLRQQRADLFRQVRLDEVADSSI